MEVDICDKRNCCMVTLVLSYLCCKVFGILDSSVSVHFFSEILHLYEPHPQCHTFGQAWGRFGHIIESENGRDLFKRIIAAAHANRKILHQTVKASLQVLSSHVCWYK